MVVQATVEEEKRKREAKATEQAEKLCDQFMTGQQEGCRLSRDKVLLTYKFLVMPQDLLVSCMMARPTAEELKRHFRSISLLLHPDKNDHPQAKEAFQTAMNAFNQASAMLSKC